MKELSVQIADLSYPYQTQIFEEELNKHNVHYRAFSKTNVDSGFSSKVYFVGSEDVEKASKIRERIALESVESEERFRQPALRILAYFALALIIIYLIYDLFKTFNYEL